MTGLSFANDTIKGGSVITEMQRQNHLPAKDRVLFNALEAEGQAKAEANRRDQGGVALTGGSVIAEMQRRAKMPPEQRANLEFLESAKVKLDEIRSGRGKGDSYIAEQKYLATLPADQRALLEKVENEAIKRPTGLYPFTHEAPATPRMQPYQETFTRSHDNGDLAPMNALRQFALTQLRGDVA